MPRYDALPANLPPRGLAREAAAQYVGISPTKFDTMIGDGRMPRPVRIDGRAVWDIRALDAAFDGLHRPGAPAVPTQVITRVIDEYAAHLLENKNRRRLDKEIKKTRTFSSETTTEEKTMRSHHKYTHPFTDRHGVKRNYFRRPGFPSAVLPYDEDTIEFLDAYRAALTGESSPKRAVTAGQISERSVDRVIEHYLKSSKFTSFAPDTQKWIKNTLAKFRREHAHEDFSALKRIDFKRMITKKEKMWEKRQLLYALRSVITLTIEEEEMFEEDPTLGIKCTLPKSTGFYSWKEEDIAAYKGAYPSGTQERRALALLLYLMQRRGDIVRLGPKDLIGGKIYLTQHKTKTPLVLPIDPELQVELDFVPADQPTFLVSKRGTPFTPGGFYNWFSKACSTVKGLDERASPHGLRKASCRRLAEAGCTAKEIQSFSGHLTLSEVQRYIDDADKEKAAEVAQEKMRRKFSRE